MVVIEGLKLEEGEFYEVGIKFENGYFSINLVFFNIEKKNMFVIESCSGINYIYLIGKV